MKLFQVFLVISSCAFGQVTINGNRTTTGVVDNSTATATLPHKSGLSAAIPATCSVGQTYFKTDASAGSNTFACTATNVWTLQGGSASSNHGALSYSIDNSGTALTAGQTRCGPTSFPGTITGWTITTDQSSSIQFGVWKTSFGSSLPTIANSIVASAPPAITTAITGTSTSLTGWTTSFVENDLVCFTITSTSTATWANLKLQVTKQ